MPSIDTNTYVSELEGNLKVAGEVSRELGVHFKDLEQVISMNLVQVAVGQCSNVAAGLSNRLMFTYVLSEHVVFTYRVGPKNGPSSHTRVTNVKWSGFFVAHPVQSTAVRTFHFAVLVFRCRNNIMVE